MIRYEFTDISIREEDIHPDFIFNKERDLARDFTANIKKSKHIQPCPICKAPRDEILFQKWGFYYAICLKSWSVSLASLPDEQVIQNYYFNSEISRLRASEEYQDMVSQKRKNLWESQLGWIESRVSRHLGNNKYTVIEWGGKSLGWIDLLSSAGFVHNLSVKESLPPIIESINIDEQHDIICLIDVLQREACPQKLLDRIYRTLKPGGLLIVSCRAGSGFDVLTLREKSDNIFPLDHIFLPSPKGINCLLEQAGFYVLELTTPGLLDLKYVKNIDHNIPKDQYFQRYIMSQKDDSLLERMQGFLQRNNLSSHLRCVARK